MPHLPPESTGRGRAHPTAEIIRLSKKRNRCRPGPAPTWRVDAGSSPEGVVAGHPVLVVHAAPEAHHLHPLGVLVDHLARGGGPLLAQAAHVQMLVLHRQPLRLEACGQGARGTETRPALRPRRLAPGGLATLGVRGHRVKFHWSGQDTLARAPSWRVSSGHTPQRTLHQDVLSLTPLPLGQRRGWGGRRSPFPTVPSPSDRMTQGTGVLPSIR